jgi:hypothetical protein
MTGLSSPYYKKSKIYFFWRWSFFFHERGDSEQYLTQENIILINEGCEIINELLANLIIILIFY